MNVGESESISVFAELQKFSECHSSTSARTGRDVASIYKRGGSKSPKAVWSVINIAVRSL